MGMDALNSMQQGLNNITGNLDTGAITQTAKELGEVAGGGLWSKFKAHAAKTMTRPGATRQAVGASAVLVGGLAITGTLTTVAGFLGVSVSCPPVAAGALLIGGAALLAYGSYKVFKHAKAVATQKAQENAQAQGKTPENAKARGRDIALEFVKQTAENVIFGVPTTLIKYIPSIRKKLETYAEKYEAKQSIGKQAENVINTIKDFEQIPTTINNIITSNDFKTNINTQLTNAQNKIKTIVNGKATEILETQLKEIKNTKEFKQLETIRNTAEKQLNRLLENSNKSLKNYGIDKDKLEKILNDINKLNLQDLKFLEKGINEKIKNSGKTIDFGFKALEHGLKALETLEKEAQNIEIAINALKNGGIENLKGEAKNILESAKSKAKDKCKTEIDKKKEEVKEEVTKIIKAQTEKIQQELQRPLDKIEQKATAAFSILEERVKTVDSVKEQVSELKTHTHQKLVAFRNYTLEPFMKDSIDEYIASLDGDMKNLNNIFDKVVESNTNLMTSLVKDGAKFAEDNAKAFLTTAKENSESTLEREVHKTENTTNNLLENILLKQK